MRKSLMLFSISLVLLFVTACNNEQANDTNDNNVESPVEVEDDRETESDSSNEDNQSDAENEVETAQNQDDMKKMMEQLDFYEIEFEVSYGHDQEFEIEIEHHSNGDIEAEVEDELNGVDINDDLEAFNYIYPNVKKLKIDKNKDKADVIADVLKAFDLGDDYEKFEVEFEFEDGTKISYEDKK